MKRLVLFVEGDGDKLAVPVLVKRLITDLGLWDGIQLDRDPFLVGGSDAVLGSNEKIERWLGLLRAANKRRNVGGILQVLDGDSPALCARNDAVRLAERAKEIGAGTTFSLACVFARQEYETWLLAGIESLAGVKRSDGCAGVRADATNPEGDLESAPRDAKRKLGELMISGYKTMKDQAALTELVDLDVIRGSELRSFKRLESALSQLALAIQTGKHVSTPAVS
jgi:hypothetical protein